MRAILDVILLALQIYVWLLIAAAVLSWLIAFNVVNTRNQFVATVGEFLYRITEPALRPIRNMMPNLGGIDISPVILILIIFLIERDHHLLHLSERDLTAWRAPGRSARGRRRGHRAPHTQGRARRDRRHRDARRRPRGAEDARARGAARGRGE